MNKRYALTIGINDYPGTGADLSGCVNDALDWADVLEERGYLVATLLDSAATREAILEEMRALVARTGWADRAVIAYSGHGTNLRDDDGDEADGSDEAWVAHDWQAGGLILDDDLYSVFSQRRFGARIALLSDSCYSGTIARLFGVGASVENELPHTPRYLSPSALGLPVTPASTPRENRTLPGRNPNVLTITGCAEDEVSWDAWFGGRPNGAMSRMAMDTLEPLISYTEWHRRLLAAIQGRCDQTPQLVPSTLTSRYWKALG